MSKIVLLCLSLSLCVTTVLLAVAPVQAVSTSQGLDLFPIEGRLVYLSEGAGTFEGAEERWIFDGEVGDQISLALITDALEAYVMLYGPSGELIESTLTDDAGNDAPKAPSIDVPELPDTGEYTIVVAGYTYGSPYAIQLFGLSAKLGPIADPIIPGPKDILQVDHLACTDSEIYFLVWLDAHAVPNHDFFEATIDTTGPASLEHILPLPVKPDPGNLASELLLILAIGGLEAAAEMQVPMAGTLIKMGMAIGE